MISLIVITDGETLEQAARAMAQRLGGRPVKIENRSGLPASAISRLSAGLNIAPDAPLTVTISENASGYVLVARFGDDAAIIPFEYQDARRRLVSLRITPLFVSAEPVLDALISDEHVVALEPSRVVLYEHVNGAWTEVLSARLHLAHPMPRDPRGRIEGSPAVFRIAVPGSNCTGSATPQAVTAGCVEALDNDWVPGRNVLRNAPAPKAPGWGSDFVDVTLGCGRFTIATRATANGEWMDQLTAFLDAQPVSDAAPTAGLITALWPSPAAGELKMTTRAPTGQYEFSRVTAACVE